MTLQEKASLDDEEARVVEKQKNCRTRQLAQERDDAGKRREARARKVKCAGWTITRVEFTYGTLFSLVSFYFFLFLFVS